MKRGAVELSFFLVFLANSENDCMAQKKKVSVYRTNLVNVGIGQGQMQTVPYLASVSEYTPEGLTLTQSSFSAEGVLVEKMAWEYDENGKVVRQSYFSEDDEPSEVIIFERNAKGEIVKETKEYIDGSADITTYVYDEKERLTEKVTVDDEGVTDLREVITWSEKLMVKREVIDAEGNRIALDEFVYDPDGHILEHRHIDEETGENFKMVSKYNEDGQKIKDKLYDEDDELVETTRYAVDKSGKLVSSTVESDEKNSTTRYVYDEKGNHLGHEEVNSEGNQVLWVEHTFDEQNNLTGSVVFANGGRVASSQHYELRYAYEWFDE